jgi:CheY-like chemotaxis protein
MAPETTKGLSGRRILVVEDEVLIAMDTKAMLEAAGCVVLGPAANIRDALAIIAGEQIDGVVLDVNLSGQLAFPISDALIARNIPFVVATGYTPVRTSERDRFHDLLHKPYTAYELLDALARVMPGRT